jgi:Ca2+-binding EF-hand superfamily protein
MSEISAGWRAFVLSVALLTSACAGNSGGLYDTYDSNNDNSLSPEEWDQGFVMLDTNGDGIVTRDEFGAAFGDGW